MFYYYDLDLDDDQDIDLGNLLKNTPRLFKVKKQLVNLVFIEKKSNHIQNLVEKYETKT